MWYVPHFSDRDLFMYLRTAVCQLRGAGHCVEQLSEGG